MPIYNRVVAANLAAILFSALLVIANSAVAHHTYVTKYDPNKLVSLKGTISSVDYRNPHIFFDLNVKTRDGSVFTWRIETESIAKAQAKGLTENKLRIGAAAVVSGWRARNGSGEIGMKSIRIGSRTYKIRRTPR